MARHRTRWFYLLITPWLIGFICLQSGPLLATILLSLAAWPLPQPPHFVGLQHYQRLYSDPLLWRALFNTGYYALGAVPLGLSIGLGLALLLNRPGRLTALLRTIFVLPLVISGVALIVLWGMVFNPRYGLINSLLAMVGITGPGWLYDPQWAMPALILMSLWGVGMNMVVYLAGLQTIPVEISEAARLDGAGRWVRLWRILLPLLSPVTLYLLVVNLIGAFQLFSPSYLLTRGGPENATLTLPLYIYLNAFSYANLGYASALAVVLLFVVGLLTLAQVRLAPRWVFYR